jgi:hypothetical protein
MAQNGEWLSWQSLTGQPVKVGALTLTPVARRLLVRWPGGGLLWLHPEAVLVQPHGLFRRRRGQVRRVPVPDPTLTLWLTLWACTLIALALPGLVYLRRRTNRETRS